MYKITVDLPNLPQGEKVEVDGVGFFNNGTTTELTDFNEEEFLSHHKPLNVMQDNATVLATYGDELPKDENDNVVAPALSVEELLSSPGITVEKVDDPEPEEEEPVVEVPLDNSGNPDGTKTDEEDDK